LNSFEQALALDSKFKKAWFNKANTLKERGRFLRALGGI
jgi:hypothetical protein